jgi:hypothetical protein
MRQVVAGFRNRARGVLSRAKKKNEKILAGKNASRIKKGDPRFGTRIASATSLSHRGQVTRE